MKALASRVLARMRFAPLAASGRLRQPVRRIVAVIDGPNPSFDYYLAPRLAQPGMPRHTVFDVSSPPPDFSAPEYAGTLMLFCRYMSGAWLRAAAAARGNLAGVALFLDDDIDALFAEVSVPLRYRLHLFRRALAHRHRLSGLLDLLFVANPAIAARHGIADARLLSPVASAADEPAPRAQDGPFRVAFHSTYVHWREHEWLMPVVADLARCNPALRLEAMAGPVLARGWKAIPGVNVVPPQPWPAYRARSRSEGADLLLAPLLSGPANAARSQTKRIDAMRLGAALLVSDRDIYRCGDEELAHGMHAPPDPALWVETIAALAADPVRVRRLRDLNRDHVRRMSATMGPLLGPGEIAR